MLDRPRSEVAWEYWLHTPFDSFLFTSPSVRHRVPPGSERALRHISVPWAKRCRSRCSSNSSMRARLLKIWNCALDSRWNFDAYIFPESPPPKKIPHVIWNPKCFHGADKSPQLAPTLTQLGPLKFFASENFRFVLISYFHISTHLLLSVYHVFFFYVFQQQLRCTYLSSLQCVLYAPPLRLSLILLHN